MICAVHVRGRRAVMTPSSIFLNEKTMAMRTK